MGALLGIALGIITWLAGVVTAVAVVGLRNNHRDADHAARSARALAALHEVDAELHTLEVHRALQRARSDELDPADATWLATVVRRAHDRRGEFAPAFRATLADDKHALDEQVARRVSAQAASQRIATQARLIAARVPAVQQAWVDGLAAHS